ncbi:MAG TPA: hypothetical protein VJH88_00970 [Candidatus Nanoarchaeia archaeon]|nr:hypothetical protein [Candidatus Nanoarchaeia archaeon]
MNLEYLGLGWKLRLRKSRASYYITIAKEVALGNLMPGKTYLYYYLVKYSHRNALLIYLDGEPRDTQTLSETSSKTKVMDINTGECL